LEDPAQWRTALSVGPLSNAQRGGKKKKSKASAVGASAEDDDEGAGGGEQSGAGSSGQKKRGRARPYSVEPDGKDGQPAWPSYRLVGKHRVGWHADSKSQHFCDYPGCDLVHTSYVAKQPKAAPAAGGGRGKGKGSGGRGKGKASAPASGIGRRDDDDDAVSEAGSVGSTGSQGRSRTKLYCLDCYDANNNRPMNFHADCWNRWHGLCPPCNE
jgi:hypothetical protein